MISTPVSSMHAMSPLAEMRLFREPVPARWYRMAVYTLQPHAISCRGHEDSLGASVVSVPSTLGTRRRKHRLLPTI